MKCPKCHSTNIQVLGKDRKGFSLGKATVGALVGGPLIGLIGFAGKNGKKYECYCNDCGKRFQAK